MSITNNIQNMVKDLTNRLSNQELTELAVSLAEYIEVVGAELSTDEIADKRFAEGLVCPHCNKRHIVSDVQFLCKSFQIIHLCVLTSISVSGELFSSY